MREMRRLCTTWVCVYRDATGVERDYAKSLKLFAASAKLGNAVGQCSAGHLYENGWGVIQDYVKAVHYYTLSAEQGLAGAQYNLACMYSLGNGVTCNLTTALSWLRMAAAQGMQKAIDAIPKLLAEIEKVASKASG